MNRVLVARVPGVGERVTADPAASHHLLRVQRVARGGRVQIADGSGGCAVALLVDVVGQRAVLEVEAPVVAAAPPARVVLLGMPKPPAVEEALTLATEAGAGVVVLVEAERTPPGRPRPERLERVVQAAVTQCGRAVSPRVVGPCSLGESLAFAVGARFVATREEAGGEDAVLPGAGLPGAGAATLAVGPEGGFSPAEQAALEAAGFARLALGPHILRTPTAVAVGLGRLYPGAPPDSPGR